MGRPVNADAASTRARILDAASRRFGQQGFAGASMREIAKDAGITGAALYHHFPGKGDLLLAVMDHMRSQILLGLQRAFLEAPPDEDGRALLTRVVRTILEVLDTPQQQQFFRILLTEAGRLPKEPLRQMQEAQRTGVAMFMQLLIQQGVLRPVAPDMAAFSFVGPIVMHRISRFLSGTPASGALNPDTFTAGHVDAFLRAYGATPQAAASPPPKAVPVVRSRKRGSP